jgi:hypothetical protein
MNIEWDSGEYRLEQIAQMYTRQRRANGVQDAHVLKDRRNVV